MKKRIILTSILIFVFSQVLFAQNLMLWVCEPKYDEIEPLSQEIFWARYSAGIDLLLPNKKTKVVHVSELLKRDSAEAKELSVLPYRDQRAVITSHYVDSETGDEHFKFEGFLTTDGDVVLSPFQDIFVDRYPYFAGKYLVTYKIDDKKYAKKYGYLRVEKSSKNKSGYEFFPEKFKYQEILPYYNGQLWARDDRGKIYIDNKSQRGAEAESGFEKLKAKIDSLYPNGQIHLFKEENRFKPDTSPVQKTDFSQQFERIGWHIGKELYYVVRKDSKSGIMKPASGYFKIDFADEKINVSVPQAFWNSELTLKMNGKEIPADYNHEIGDKLRFSLPSDADSELRFQLFDEYGTLLKTETIQTTPIEKLFKVSVPGKISAKSNDKASASLRVTNNSKKRQTVNVSLSTKLQASISKTTVDIAPGSTETVTIVFSKVYSTDTAKITVSLKNNGTIIKVQNITVNPY